ncbi:MAG: hypothetical protein U0Q11_11720 [Vicinamibacterales bacterium]
MSVRTTWVSPARAISGQDHLAVLAVSQRLFTELLPGITNVTLRVRLYSFYPWLVRAFDRHIAEKTSAQVVDLVRRAEVLLALIGIAHELETGVNRDHGGGLVGRDVLVDVARRVLAGGTVRLSDHASEDAPAGIRYFKSTLGALGANYLGPLRELEVLGGDAAQGVKWAPDWGAALADLYETGVDGAAFFAALERDEVDAATLHSLRAFCPCGLDTNDPERSALEDLLFQKAPASLAQVGGELRRATLLALIAFVQEAEQADEPATDLRDFLATAYAGATADGRQWSPPPLLQDVVARWRVYQRHELLSMAVQGLFWAALTWLCDEKKAYTSSRTAFVRDFALRFETVLPEGTASARFTDIISTWASGLPPLERWRDERHEIGELEALEAAQKAGDVDGVARHALQILGSLVARGPDTLDHHPFDIDLRFLQTYSINLQTLRAHSFGIWPTMTGREWLEWLAGHWVLDAHLRVALRKLRYQLQDTFRLVPGDDGFRVREDGIPPAQLAAPRLRSAFRFLYDLGLLDRASDEEDASYQVTPRGAALLEALGG